MYVEEAQPYIGDGVRIPGTAGTVWNRGTASIIRKKELRNSEKNLGDARKMCVQTARLKLGGGALLSHTLRCSPTTTRSAER